ncbi:MAG: error-prone DNA polymerase [Candidatus Limnocylindrales bacterium]
MSGPSGFVHLRCHSSYSFLDGASSVDALVSAAAAQGQDTLALTDTGGLYGAVRFWNAARLRGLRAIFGCDLDLRDLPGLPDRAESERGGASVRLLAADRIGWTSLCRIVSAAQLAGQKGRPQATLALVAGESAGLIALSETDDPETLGRLHEVFGGRLYAELVDRWGPDDIARADARAEQAASQGIATVITNDVRYARPEDRRLHDVLRCIALGTTVDAAGRRLAANGERWLKGETDLRARLGHHPDAFANTRQIADRCVVDLGFGYQRLPGFSVPAGHTAFSFLYTLCGDGARMKYGRVTPAVSRQLAHELDVIDRCGLAEFFLINWDIVRFCNDRRIPAQGRGSAADSIVAYVLDITKVDPIAHDLLFERFLTEDSHTMPDIDLDIASNDREEVIQYVYRRYGERYAAMVCNVVTYRPRSASREVAKALGFREELIDRLAKSVETPRYDSRGPSGGFVQGGDRDLAHPDTPEELTTLERQRWPLYEALRGEIADLPRHLSIHNGGMLITALPLVDTVPIERATMSGRNVVQFDKRDIEDLGLIKMDLLGLRTLSLIKDCVAMIDELHAVRLDLGTIPLEDPAVYDLLCEVDTIGVFQVESRAQGQALPRVRPRCFADIVVQVAIIRPGPLQGNMVNPYIRRRQGREPVTYLHPLLEPILKETLGVILFQEQILKVAMAVAGFSAAEADRLRRAMSRARSGADMERLREPFVRGARGRGVADGIANEIFRQVAAFAEFGFCKSHAAAFALTAYHTAHLKLYYPAEFVVALLNNQPMGFYSPAVIAGDAKRHGIAVLPVDVDRSGAKAMIEERAVSGHDDDLVADRSVTIARHRACRTHDIRLGLGSVKGLGEAEAAGIVAEREARGPFCSFDDFARRVGVKEEALRNLALVGAFDRFGEPRRALLWRAREAHRGSPAFSRPVLAYPTTAAPALPALGEQERAALDYRITGIPTGPQVMRFYRERLAARGVGSSADIQQGAHGQRVHVAGAIVVKQHPETAKGHVFLSLEDEYGLLNVIIRPATYAKYKRVVDQGGAVVIQGTLQHVDGVISVLAIRLDELGLFVKLVSRDWQ